MKNFVRKAVNEIGILGILEHVIELSTEREENFSSEAQKFLSMIKTELQLVHRKLEVIYKNLDTWH